MTAIKTILLLVTLFFVCKDTTCYVINAYEEEEKGNVEKRDLVKDLDIEVEQDLNKAFDEVDTLKDNTEVITPKKEYQDAMESRVVDDESCITDCTRQPLSDYCGTNGITYKSKCELYNAVCRSGGTIDEKSKGPCGASKDQEKNLRNYISNMLLRDTEKKDTEDNHKHHKREETCITNCAPYGEDPYCGTNGITYKNKCEMYNAICKSGGKFDEKGKGPCGRRDSKISRLGHNKRNVETCITNCAPYGEDPYCATNGKTYKNKCEMYNAICRSGGMFEEEGKGACGRKDSETLRSGQSKRVAETCITNCAPYGEDPYCGTNGITYKNKCEMYNAICNSGGKFDEKGKGPCGRKDVVIKYNKRAETCMSDCSAVPYIPYCGSNGITYNSKCDLYNAQCKTNGAVLEKAKGECGLLKDEEENRRNLRNYIASIMRREAETCITNCAPYGEDPYCATNGKTYKNKCEMYNAICRSGGKFDEKGRGSCGRKDFNHFRRDFLVNLHSRRDYEKKHLAHRRNGFQEGHLGHNRKDSWVYHPGHNKRTGARDYHIDDSIEAAVGTLEK